MIRVDFVSNSSSCSFFIYLKNDNAVEQFKKLFNIVKKYASIQKIINIDDLYGYSPVVENYNDIEKEMYYLLYCGTDDDLETIDKCSDLAYKFNECNDIILYQDPYAHSTHGKELPNN